MSDFNYQELNINCKDLDHIGEILALHHMKLIPQGFISSLGVKFISLLYKSLIISKGFYVLACFDSKRDKKLVGYSVLRMKKSSYIFSVLRNYPYKTLYLCFFYLKNPKKIIGFIELFIFQFFKNPSKNNINTKKVAELFIIAILEDYQGKGIGGHLIQKTKERCRLLSINEIYAVTGSEQQTHKFYKKIGGQLIGQTSIHNNHLSHIYKILCNE